MAIDGTPRGPAWLRQGIAQIALVVPDLDKAVERYWTQFGIGPWHFYTYQRPLLKAMSYHGAPTDYAMRLALSYLGPLRIELIEVGQGDTVYRDFVAEHGYGVHHLGIVVPDMQQAIAEGRRAGYELVQDGQGFGRDGDGHYAYLDTTADLGVMLELIERPAGRVPPEKVYPPPEAPAPDAPSQAEPE